MENYTTDLMRALSGRTEMGYGRCWRRKARRVLISGALLLLFLSDCVPNVNGQTAVWPTEGWEVASPESRRLDASVFRALDAAVRSGSYGFVDRLVVVRDGFLVVDERYDNDYRSITRGVKGPLGCGFESCSSPDEVHEFNYYHPDFHPFYRGTDAHSLQSVTKSVSATLIGIALKQGVIEGLDVSMLSFFDDYDLSQAPKGLESATLEDLLTMRSGIEWHEQDRPLDGTNTTLQLERSEDWIQFTLDQPMDAEPGEKWSYNSGGSHLMSGIIKTATGEYIDRFAEEYLFGPLGIRSYHWKKTPRGFPDTEGGLYLEAKDLAKIGLLYLRGGVWDRQRILSDSWVKNATSIHADSVNVPGWGYGFQWWRLDRRGTVVWAGLGFGGQFLIVLPEYDIVGVVNCWNLYRRPDKNILDDFLNALISSARSGS